MTLQEFRHSLELANAPPGVGPMLLALWHDGRGQWEEAHRIVQDIDHPDAAWIHAYLHRKEGDESNAKYWYHLAGKKFTTKSFPEEWEDIVSYFLYR